MGFTLQLKKKLYITLNTFKYMEMQVLTFSAINVYSHLQIQKYDNRWPADILKIYLNGCKIDTVLTQEPTRLTNKLECSLKANNLDK